MEVFFLSMLKMHDVLEAAHRLINKPWDKLDGQLIKG